MSVRMPEMWIRLAANLAGTAINSRSLWRISGEYGTNLRRHGREFPPQKV
jgi:hypothetical protein